VQERAAALSQFLSQGSRATRAKLTLLRMCNELLRRLSKSKNTNFCGRVLLMMAYALPISERSGVNLKGASAEFALSCALAAPLPAAARVPRLDTSPPRVGRYAEDEKEGGIDEPAASAKPAAAGGASVDFDFYSTFWGLQRAFSEPAQAVSAEAWPGLVKNLEAVLQVFSAFGSADGATDGGEEAAADAGGEVAEEDAAAMEVDGEAEALQEVYFAKFLTSPKLINLQLRDAYFRRHLLVQLRIFLQTIGSERKGFPPLRTAQREAAEALATRSSELLRAVPPGGPSFAATLDKLLERERHWMKWKNTGCQAFDKAAQEQLRTGAKRKSAGAARPSKRVAMGNTELTRLWNLGSNSLASISQQVSKRQGVPSLEEYLQPVIEQGDPEAGIEEQYKVKNDKVFAWKALRLMAKKDVTLLAKVAGSTGKEQADGLEKACMLFAEKQKQQEAGDAPAPAEEAALGS
jgi:THO complex subunit 1